MEKALEHYQRAYKKSPLEPAVLIGMARASQELEDYRITRKTYEELKKVSPGLAQQFSYLELRGEESVRAAEISGAKEMVVWAEELAGAFCRPRLSSRQSFLSQLDVAMLCSIG